MPEQRLITRLVGRSAARAAILVACALAAATAAPAGAQPTFTVTSSRPAAARSYVDVDGLLANGFARDDGSRATYEIPVRLLYPLRRSGCGQVGLEDLANGFGYNFPTLRSDFWNLHFARRALTDRFLAMRRVFYASPTWDKKAIDRLRRGHLQRRADATRAIADVSRWLRDPSSVRFAGAPPSLPPPRCTSTTVLGYGYSDSASLLRMLFVDGEGDRLFDGGIVDSAGATCWNFTIGQALDQCPALPPALRAKVMSLDTETDIDIQSAAAARQDGLGHYRHYELAGSAHLPKAQADLMEFSRQAQADDPAIALVMRATGRYQNPESIGPALRAVFAHLVRWVRRDIAPPRDAYLQGSFDPTGTFTIARDSDGNAIGGARMPWLATRVGGTTVGAPLGSHSGTDVLGGFALGGRYECFDDIRARYPAAAGYVARVAAGSRFAKAQGWILEQDRRTYVRLARRLDLGRVPCPPWPYPPE